jgi:adenylate kinase
MEKEQTVILISGTPGTGKTTIAQVLKEEYSAFHLNLTDVAIENGFILEEDRDRQTKVVDEDKLVLFIEDFLKTHLSNVIIEGHYADIVPDELTTVFIILRTDPHVLEQRLQEKQFPISKIRENIQSEVLGTCTSFALETHDRAKIYEVDTSTAPLEETVKLIQQYIKQRPASNVGEINWLQKLDATDKLMELFR